MSIRYTESLDGIMPDALVGFFEGWKAKPNSQRHLQILRGSQHVVLAVDDSAGKVVGFINAIGDGCNSAFVPLLEVLPEYRRRGIGSELVRRMFAVLGDYPCIDLVCDHGLQPFYERLGMHRSTAMIWRA